MQTVMNKKRLFSQEYKIRFSIPYFMSQHAHIRMQGISNQITKVGLSKCTSCNNILYIQLFRGSCTQYIVASGT